MYRISNLILHTSKTCYCGINSEIGKKKKKFSIHAAFSFCIIRFIIKFFRYFSWNLFSHLFSSPLKISRNWIWNNEYFCSVCYRSYCIAEDFVCKNSQKFVYLFFSPRFLRFAHLLGVTYSWNYFFAPELL